MTGDDMLFDLNGIRPAYTLARVTDPETCKVAAGMASERGPNQRVRVFRYFLAEGAATDFEVSHALNMLRSSTAKRRQELTDLGLIVDSGHRRATDTGVAAIVWRITYQDTGDLRRMTDEALAKHFAQLITTTHKDPSDDVEKLKSRIALLEKTLDEATNEIEGLREGLAMANKFAEGWHKRALKAEGHNEL